MKTEEQYKNVAIAAHQLVKEKEYWQEKLSGELTRSSFPYDFAYKKAAVGDTAHTAGGEVFFKIDREITARIMEITAGEYPQIHMILTAVTAALLTRYTGNRDIIIGTSIDRQEIQGTLINTLLPLRIAVTLDMTFKEMLFAVRKVINEAIENQNYPVETLPCHPGEIVDVVVLLENLQERAYLRHLTPGINFYFQAAGDEIKGEMSYDTSRYERGSIERLVGHLLQLLKIALFNVNMKIDDISLLSVEDKESLDLFNRTSSQYPHRNTIHELFAAQVARTPGDIALIESESSGDVSVTYKQLDEQANRLSCCLANQGVKPGSIIALLMEPSAELVSAILAVLKSGCAYLPLDIDYPQERKLYILKDSGAVLLLTRKAQAGSLEWPGEILYLEDIDLPGAEPGHGGIPVQAGHQGSPTDLAYVIYTSGSTGKPKGVAVEHRSLVNYTWWAAKNYIGAERINMPFYTSIAFDLTVTSLYPPLVTGNTVIIYRGKDREFLVEKILRENRVDVIKLTPVHLMLIGDSSDITSRIRRFIVGGEALETPLALKIHDNFQGNIEIYNEYGPTEATVGCMIHRFAPAKDKGAAVPIGIPAGNVQIYLFDRSNREVPPGGVGELVIAGDSLARGYLNKPGLTAEKFLLISNNHYMSHRSDKSDITSPSYIANKRLYKTGDLGRRLWDGTIEFLGRVDQQVKIRGYRVEISEVENCLARHPLIRQNVVEARDDGSGYKYLAAYFVPAAAAGSGEAAAPIETGELRDYLAAHLPEFMIPSAFVPLEKLPLTPNGKVDRKSLPDPAKMNPAAGGNYCPPGSEWEKIMATVWQEVMGVDTIGIDDNYFSLGGDSIKAIQISSRLRKHNLKLEIGDLFQYPSIRELTGHVQPLKDTAYQGLIEGEVPLAPIQQWFFQLGLTDMHHFNQSVMLFRAEKFREEIVEKVFHKLLEHHDALRMVYLTTGEQIKQMNRGVGPDIFHMHVYEIEADSYEEQIEAECNRIQAGMELSRGPLVKLALFKTVKGDFLLIAIHHLVIDGLSWRIIFEDFTSLYLQLENGVEEEKLEIPLKTNSYKEWAEKLVEYANSQNFLREVEYWQNLEKQGPLPLQKPAGATRGKNSDSRGLSFQLSVDYTEKLLKQVNQAYNTEINDILLTAAGLALSEWQESQRIPMILEGHGRESIIPTVDINRTVGWFTSIYPVILDMRSKGEIGQVIKDTKEMMRNIPHKGIGYGILRYLTAEEKKSGMEWRLNPVTSFNYLGQVDEDINTGVFQAAPLSSGHEISPESERMYPLYITGVVFNKRLQISVNYDSGEYTEKEMQDLLKGCEKYLLKVIDHCSARDESELTVSDFSTTIQKEEADLVFDILSQKNLEG